MKPLVSIIIPVYNVEKYLRECLDSVRNQTLREIEVICVDDGSTDASGRILDEYAAEDERFIVIHQENTKQGKARNRAIPLARGTYTGFCDSDDRMEPEMCEKLYALATETGSDIAQCSYKILGKMKDPLRKFPGTFYSSETEKVRCSDFSPCNKLYKTSLLQQNPIRFVEGKYYEDVTFSKVVPFYANQIAQLHETLYFYRYGVGCSVDVRKGERWKDWIFTYHQLYDELKRAGAKRETLDYIQNQRFRRLRHFWTKDFRKNRPKDLKETLLGDLTEEDWEILERPNRRLRPKVCAFFFCLAGKPLKASRVFIGGNIRSLWEIFLK